MFEVRKRDGLSRRAVFTTEDCTLMLPGAVSVCDLFPSLQEEGLTNIPLSAPADFVRQYFYGGTGQPVHVHPLADPMPARSGDCIIIDNWHTAFANPRNYVTWLVQLKEKIPPDTAWYAPAAAIPSNAHILCYSGFDLFDFTAVDLITASGRFCLPEGEFPPDFMESGVCGCEGCQDSDLLLHNRLALERELALISRFIDSGQMRELVEARCRLQAAHVAILRHLDRHYPFMEARLPVAREGRMGAMTAEMLNRPEVRRFAERVVGRYQPPDADTVVLLPCSAKKPYSFSQSHRAFIRAVEGRALELIVTSPIGLVPRELERIYPAAHYDVPVTGYWDREEKAFAAEVISEYFKRHPPKRVIAHLEGGALETARMAAEIRDIDLEVTCTGHPASAASIRSLEEACAGGRKVRTDPIRGTGSWQFGIVMDTKCLILKGRYPRIGIFKGRTPCFALDPGTGLLKPTFDGWDLVPEGYRVTIDDFIPQGDILAPGIVDADPVIREGDEVLVVGPRAMATGKAVMPAEEMKSSARGVAIRVRKIKRF